MTAGAIAVVFAVVVFIVVRDNDPSGSENGSSTGLTLNSPVGLAVADDGSVVVADDANHRIVMLDESGAVSGLITDPEGQSVEGVSEMVTPLDSPVGVATHGEVLYIADAQAHRVVAVDPDGTVRSVAGPGDGTVGSGDGGPAIYATLGLPSRLAASPDGALFVSDVETHGVRLIGTDEVMSRFAGGDEPGFAGDGGLAVDALLNSPGGMAVAGGGILYIADTLNHRIRAVDTNSVITTVAGTGAQDFSGDDGPAIEAELGAPNDVAIGPDGSLYIADSSNHRIRRIGSDGTITTVAGTGSSGYSGDGGPAIEAELNNPVAIAVDLNGNLYITDGQNQCIRKVSAEGVITTILG